MPNRQACGDPRFVAIAPVGIEGHLWKYAAFLANADISEPVGAKLNLCHICLHPAMLGAQVLLRLNAACHYVAGAAFFWKGSWNSRYGPDRAVGFAALLE